MFRRIQRESPAASVIGQAGSTRDPCGRGSPKPAKMQGVRLLVGIVRPENVSEAFEGTTSIGTVRSQGRVQRANRQRIGGRSKE